MLQYLITSVSECQNKHFFFKSFDTVFVPFLIFRDISETFADNFLSFLPFFTFRHLLVAVLFIYCKNILIFFVTLLLQPSPLFHS